MWFVAIGTLLVLAKLAELGSIGGWSWWLVLAPFGLAVLWWAFADVSGLTKRRAAEREDERVGKRRQRHFEALGLGPRRGSAGTKRPPARQDPSEP